MPQPSTARPGTATTKRNAGQIRTTAKISTPRAICAIANFIIHPQKCPGSLRPIAASISNIPAGRKIIPRLKILSRLTTSIANALTQTNILPRWSLLLLNTIARSPSTPIKAMKDRIGRA